MRRGLALVLDGSRAGVHRVLRPSSSPLLFFQLHSLPDLHPVGLQLLLHQHRLSNELLWLFLQPAAEPQPDEQAPPAAEAPDELSPELPSPEPRPLQEALANSIALLRSESAPASPMAAGAAADVATSMLDVPTTSATPTSLQPPSPRLELSDPSPFATFAAVPDVADSRPSSCSSGTGSQCLPYEAASSLTSMSRPEPLPAEPQAEQPQPSSDTPHAQLEEHQPGGSTQLFENELALRHASEEALVDEDDLDFCLLTPQQAAMLVSQPLV